VPVVCRDMGYSAVLKSFGYFMLRQAEEFRVLGVKQLIDDSTSKLLIILIDIGVGRLAA
jgi:hypothetical protein